jgi:prolyl-tRNA editing enzyme YbaK/EbsC (Cys-tRNA(Pro) deacylase)
VDFKKLKKVINEKSVRMATPDEILSVTGYQVGAIPPFALKNQLKTFLDAKTQHKSMVYVGAGKLCVEPFIWPAKLEPIIEGNFIVLLLHALTNGADFNISSLERSN